MFVPFGPTSRRRMGCDVRPTPALSRRCSPRDGRRSGGARCSGLFCSSSSPPRRPTADFVVRHVGGPGDRTSVFSVIRPLVAITDCEGRQRASWFATARPVPRPVHRHRSVLCFRLPQFFRFHRTFYMGTEPKHGQGPFPSLESLPGAQRRDRLSSRIGTPASAFLA